jgi:peptidoglycan LD-endopeptidase CwlK
MSNNMGEIDFLFDRIKTGDLYQPFFLRCKDMLLELADEKGLFFYATSGVRTIAEQDALWQKGRDKNGKVIDPKGGGIVTKAKGGSSAHNFKAATDFCKDGDTDKAGLQPIWKTSEYQELADCARRHGLEAGYYWTSIVDGPHIQLPLQAHGIKLAELYALYKKGGYDAVFDRLDKETW